jgi:hypothetical protein
MTERDQSLTRSAVLPGERRELFARVAQLLRRAARYLQPDQRVDALRSVLHPGRPVRTAREAAVVAVECVAHPLYFSLFAAICEDMREVAPIRVELVVTRSINAAVGTALAQVIARSAWVGRLVSRNWIRAFRGIADGVAYRSQSLSHPLGDLIDWWRSRALARQARDSATFAELQIDGVQVGDLIIDSYVRFRPRANFEPHDSFTRLLIWQACRDVRRANAYFGKRRPLLYLTSYSAYIQHGIPVRVALMHGVAVISFGSLARFAKQLSHADWYHTPDTRDYKARFESLDRQGERLSQAEQQLNTRFLGGIDPVTSYMRVSAYRRTAEAVPPVAGATVVFLHDFYDSLHVYPDVVFHDFWQWACCTIDVLKASGQRFFVKPHPNQIMRSGVALADLRQKYPDLPLISSTITNSQLAQAGMACGVTMYGSVAHELAYFGVPSIACARHPHNAFDFCRTARTLAEYEQYLRAAGETLIDKAEMRRQALIFYYMHNLHGSAAELALRQQYVDFWKASIAESTPGEVREIFATLRSGDAFRRLGAALRSGAIPEQQFG